MRGRGSVLVSWLSVAALVLVGLGSMIRVMETIPDNAIVLADDPGRVMLPPLVSLLDQIPSLRFTTYGEATKAGYRSDSQWRNKGYFIGEEDSLLVSYLKDWGILKPNPRWNSDGSWNW